MKHAESCPANFDDSDKYIACPECLLGQVESFDFDGNPTGLVKCDRCNGLAVLEIRDVLMESSQYRAAKAALKGRIGFSDNQCPVEEACRQYVLAEEHLPDIYDDEDYSLSGSVKSLVDYKNERDVLETRTQEMEPDVKLIEGLDELVCGDDSVSFCEEDGGVVCSVNKRKVQNNYVGSTVREALRDAIQFEK